MAITFLPVSDNSDSSNTAKARVTAKILNYTDLDNDVYYAILADSPQANINSEFTSD